jgi:5-formyltetrahydrofolate cyclo-ligase
VPPPPDKAALRADFRARLATLDPAAAGERSNRLCARLTAAMATVHSVMAFAPIPGEPDITPVLDWLWTSGRRLCLPRVNWTMRAMEPAQVAGIPGSAGGSPGPGAAGPLDLRALLVPTRHGILEPPPTAPAIPITDLDAVLVPGLAFDARGHRLGRGGGFYDRFLSHPLLRADRIGVAFDLQIADTLPADPHDACVGAIATESRLILVR